MAFFGLQLGSSGAFAQAVAPGFAVERLYTSAAGGGWLVMDTLDMHGGLGGALVLSSAYAARPLRLGVPGQAARLAVVSDQASSVLGLAATYDRWRLYVDFSMPWVLHGQSGSVAGQAFVAPDVDPSSQPDKFSDTRLGIDRRFVGHAGAPLRLGAGIQVYLPTGNRADYDSDGNLRAQGRLLLAGDWRQLSYAGHLGGHLRLVDEPGTLGSPRGSELLFGLALGSEIPLPGERPPQLVLGPEIWGATPFGALFGGATTALEGMLSARLTLQVAGGVQLRVKLGAGAGLRAQFGAPLWRALLAVEALGWAS